ncbi:8.6 kDa transglutaminase substrate-like [Tachypleus tridentatus]|uniref:8.6 kDa transglutaminase substrate-like n=1 Tax=Tachypleus tridentatus TaxID=6853 RepID=UPI003FD46873
MKWILFSVCITIALCGVNSFSQPHCPDTCDPQQCPPLNPNPCPCGTYKGMCDCCEFCYACRGQECNKVGNQRCEGNQICQIPDGYSIYHIMTGQVKGVCPL